MILSGDWWSSLSGIQQVFWGISIVFSVLFIIQFVLSLIGLDFDGDVDLDVDTDMDGEYNLDPSFSLLSVRGIIAFFTFFGWTGVLVLNAGGSTLMALLSASFAGFLAMFIVGYMIYMFSKLSQPGNIDVSRALFEVGEVYLTVPANKNGHGKIHLKIQGVFKEMDAVTDGDVLPTGSSVRIVEVLNDNLLLVEPEENYTVRDF
ncbi:MAG: hypothetical protein AB8G15_11880 [Saprospiraceae bacterium]